MSKITLGRVIKNARNELNLTQEELLALIVGSSDSRYSNKLTIFQLFQIEDDLLTDIGNPKWDWLPSSLAAAFNVDRSWLEIIRRQTLRF